MPDADGFEAAAAARARWPGVQVIFMSGFCGYVDETDCIPEADFIAKPFTRAQLLAAVSPSRGCQSERKIASAQTA